MKFKNEINIRYEFWKWIVDGIKNFEYRKNDLFPLNSKIRVIDPESNYLLGYIIFSEVKKIARNDLIKNIYSEYMLTSNPRVQDCNSSILEFLSEFYNYNYYYEYKIQSLDRA